MRDFLAKLNTLGITERDMMLALVWKQIKYLENEQQNLIIEITKIVEFEKEEDNNELIKEIKTFFLNKYDFNLNEDNTQEDAIKKVNEKLNQNLINKENKKVIIKLWDYQNNNNNLQLKEMSIYLAIYINDKLINDQIYQPIKLHLINITISKKNQMILNKIINYFEKEFDYNEHKFTTNNTRYDAFELVKILIQNLIGNEYYHLQIDFINPSKAKIIDNSKKVTNGDYFKINIKIGSLQKEILFKIKNVKDYILYLLEEILLAKKPNIFDMVANTKTSYDEITNFKNAQKIALLLMKELNLVTKVSMSYRWNPFFITINQRNFWLIIFRNERIIIRLPNDILELESYNIKKLINWN
ncbi:hypothetical protein [Spiroplasma endosymbiont of Dilophus febrilis]|uniref:hypothetical protein n=2 Tax=unclassified Spiroplasma TaxID=2637901 RepID=UPI00313F328E